MPDRHDLHLVVLAATVCLFACYSTLSLVVRSKAAEGSRRAGWLAAATAVAGIGIWATHLIATLAFESGYAAGYDVGPIALSAAIAIAISGLGIVIAEVTGLPLLGGAILGIAIGATHYAGVAWLVVQAVPRWDTGFALAAGAIGIAGAAPALWLVLRREGVRTRAFAAVVLALGICGLHFTAAAAIEFAPDGVVPVPGGATDPGPLAVAIAALAVLIAAIGLFGALADERFARRAAEESDRRSRHVADLERLRRALHEANTRIEAATAANADLERARFDHVATMARAIQAPLHDLLEWVDGLDPTQLGEMAQSRDRIADVLDLAEESIDVSALESGDAALKDDRVDLGGLAKLAAKRIDGLAIAEGIRLRLDIPESVPPLCADRSRITRMLNRLLSVTVRSVEGGGTLWIAVAPSEGGIALELVGTGRLAPLVEAPSDAPTDLDLHLVRRIAALHGGTLDVGEDGTATAYRLTLPADRVVRAPVELATSNPAAAAQAYGSDVSAQAGKSKAEHIDALAARRLRVLVAEDNAVNQKVIVAILSPIACAAEIVANGAEAVAAVTAGRFDLVLMDVQMPDMNGLLATEAIRALHDPAKAAIPVIAVTANAMKGDRERCLASGMNGYVAKPIDVTELFATMRSCLEDADRRAQSTPGPAIGGLQDCLAGEAMVVA